MQDLRKPVTMLVFLLGIVLIAYLWPFFFGFSALQAPQADRGEEFIPGPPSPEVLIQLEKSRGFEVLISYTDEGFEPREATIRRGESVRFTNNSSHDLWVAAAGTTENPSYPGVSECGGSTFDSCHTLRPRDFWEFTFVEDGTWIFQNNLDKTKAGAVEVHVI